MGESRRIPGADVALVTSAAAELSDELVRDARARYARRRLVGVHATAVFAVEALAVIGAAVATAAFLSGGPAFSLARLVFFVVLYAVVSRVEFEIGSGLAIPTQVVLVPM